MQNYFISLTEASKFLGLSKSYVYKLTHSRKVPYYKPTGGRIYFRVDELAKWVSDGRIKTDNELNQIAAESIHQLRKGTRK